MKLRRGRDRDEDPRLLRSFALSSLAIFLAVGATLSFVVSRQIRQRQEAEAQFHTQFVSNSILRYLFKPSDLKPPLDPKSDRYQALRDEVLQRFIVAPVVRLKIWGKDGTILFSDDPRLMGKKFTPDADLAAGFGGRTVGGVTDLTDPENVLDRSLAPKLLQTYTPLYLDSARNRDVPFAVAEIYTDYAGIQSEVNRLFGTLVITLLVGMAVLYALLLPISRRVGRTLSGKNAKLERQARKLTELLTKEKGTVAELRGLNRIKSEFVAIASHELRTPLTSIIGYAKTLRRPEFAADDAARDEFLGAIERQGDRLFRLVQNLLTTSQVEDEESRLPQDTFQFADLVDDVVAGLGPSGSRVHLAVEKDLPALTSDRQRVELIASNLLDNALKFSPPDAPCKLGARRDGQSLVFWVKDDGVGIAREQLSRIFDRFYQVDSSVTRKYGGVGLGLSLVKQLVTALGGTVEVESSPGHGSTFTVRLPWKPTGDRRRGKNAEAEVRATVPVTMAFP